MPTKNNLPKNQNITAQIHQVVRSAPLPSPDEFGQYEDVLPGAAERILAMAEQQARHRQRTENVDNVVYVLAVIFAFVVFMSCLFMACFALYLGNVTFALTAFLATAVSTVVSFISRKPKSKKNEKSTF